MKRIGLKYGAMMLGSFIGFFLIMYGLGQADSINLRIFNGVFHFGFLYLAIREYRKTYPNSVHNYVSGAVTGLYVSVPAVTLFTIFMAIFMAANSSFMDAVNARIPYDRMYINPLTASMFIFVEGTAIGLIGSYILSRIVDAQYSEMKMEGSDYHD